MAVPSKIAPDVAVLGKVHALDQAFVLYSEYGYDAGFKHGGD